VATIYYTASSSDGFIADPDNSLSWLLSRDVDRAGPMGYDDFIAKVGAMVGGGDLAGQFADEARLDEVWVQYASVSLGAGAPLLPRRIELQLLDVARNRDFACARYAVVR
jgi:dihydrofolate reductase